MMAQQINTPRQVLFASLVGTTVEFFDFYIYATAAVLVFPKLFFPATDPTSSMLASLATFGIAFLARPVGSALFGHFGDRIGRKRTLVVALSTMGLSTFLIGMLPGYMSIGVAAPLLLALCRFGQGIGLGGEWGGAILLAVENAPPNKRAMYGMFPQLGAPIGFLMSGGTFLMLSKYLTNEQFFSVWMEAAVPGECGASDFGVVGAADDYGDAGVRRVTEKGGTCRVSDGEGASSPSAVFGGGHVSVYGDFCPVLFDDGVRVVVGRDDAALQPGGIPAAAAVCDAFLCGIYSCFGVDGGAREKARDDSSDGGDRAVWFGARTAVFRGTHRCGRDAGAGARANGDDVRAAGDGGVGTVSDAGAIYGELAGVQYGRNSWGVAGAFDRHMAGEESWDQLCGVLPCGVGRGDDGGIANGAGDARC